MTKLSVVRAVGSHGNPGFAGTVLEVCYVDCLDILLPKEPSQGFVLPLLFFTTRQRTRKLALRETFLEVVSLLKPSNISPSV